MEDVLRAIVLGVVQGLTEFLPISSSGHLIVVRDLLGWEFTDDLTFDVSLHLGTTIAVVAFFWREWLQMVRSVLLWATGQKERRAAATYDEKLFGLILLGSLPIAVVGFVLQDWIENEVRSPEIVGIMFIVFGIVLWLADRLGGGSRTTADSSPPDALAIGAAQVISLVPGVSRSGVTISAGLFRRFSRQEAARLSFLLSTPAIVGAALLTLSDAASEGTLNDDLDVILAGGVTAAVVGWLCIALLLRYVQTGSYFPFVVYRLVVGAFIIAYFAV